MLAKRTFSLLMTTTRTREECILRNNRARKCSLCRDYTDGRFGIEGTPRVLKGPWAGVTLNSLQLTLGNVGDTIRKQPSPSGPSVWICDVVLL